MTPFGCGIGRRDPLHFSQPEVDVASCILDNTAGSPSAHDEGSKARLQAVIDTAADGIIIIDARGEVQVYNPACERLFGYQAEEVIGRNVKMLTPSPYRDSRDSYLAHCRTTRERRIIGTGRVVVGQRRDGNTFPMELAVGKARVGSRWLFTGFIRDITDQRGSERRIHELQSELLHVSRLSAMGEMASALAHELNQPLTAVMNYVKAAHRTLDGARLQIAKAQELIDEAAAQTTRAGHIIRRLREFIEKGEPQRRLENLNRVVEEANALELIGVAESNVKVRLELGAELPALLLDKVQIQQVLLNLIRNGVEAMQSSPRRELTIATMQSAAEFTDVTVSDTGLGLPKSVAERLFQPFVTTKPNGMGIGLSISRSIVDAHGGSLWAVPNRDAGMTFRFRLPIAQTDADNGGV